MKGLFWVLLIFALAVAFTLAGKNDSAYVVLVYPPYRVELALNLLIALLVLSFFLGYMLLRFAIHTLRLPAYVRAFRVERKRKKGRKAMLDGLLAFFEGRYGKAEKFARKAVEMREFPAVTASVAARAAHELKAYERRDDYLDQAERLAPGYPIARLMTQAELLLDQRRPQEALAVLKQLHQAAPKHIPALKLELRAQQQARNWDEVIALTAVLEKREAIDASRAEQLKINAYLENLKRKAPDGQALQEYWQKIPADIKLNGEIALNAARYFVELEGLQKANEIIEQSLARQWDSDLVSLYGHCPGKDPLKQIQRAEKWLSAHPRDAGLLLTLGILCTRQELWGKAQSYLEASLGVEPGYQAHVALAQLLEKLQRPDEACRHYRLGMERALDAKESAGVCLAPVVNQ